MTPTIKKCLNNSFSDFLTQDEFITEFKKNPNQWIAFRETEFNSFINLLLEEVFDTVQTAGAAADTLDMIRMIKNHFNMGSDI